MFAFSDKKRGYRHPCCKKCFNFRAREKWHATRPNASRKVNELNPITPNNIQEIILQEKEEKFFLEHYCDGLKKCSACQEYKEISLYYKDKETRDGLLAQCKSCISKPEHDHIRHNKNPWLRTFSNSKTRAKKLSLPFSLTKEFVKSLFEQSNGVCPVLNIPMIVGGELQNVPSLDRIKGEFGYIPSNVRLISYRANSLKQDATITELQLVLQDLERTR